VGCRGRWHPNGGFLLKLGGGRVESVDLGVSYGIAGLHLELGKPKILSNSQ
jgi:hypothetical protein